MILAVAFFFYALNKEGSSCIKEPKVYYETLYNVSCFCSNDLELPSNWGEIGT